MNTRVIKQSKNKTVIIYREKSSGLYTVHNAEGEIWRGFNRTHAIDRFNREVTQ